MDELALAGGQVDSEAGFEDWLQAALLRALALPLTDEDRDGLRGVERAMARVIGLDQEAAAAAARHALLLRRARALFELLALQCPIDRFVGLVDQVMFDPPILDSNLGTVIVAGHFGLYSTLLWLRLTRASIQGRLPHLTCLYDSGPDGKSYWASPQRLREFAEAGLLDPDQNAWIDRRQLGGPAAARDLVDRLRSGQAVLVFVDPYFVPRPARSMPVHVGRLELGLPRGAAWLAERSGSQVLPVHIQPDRSGSGCERLVFGPVFRASTIGAAVQDLFDRSVLTQPGLWEGWFRLPTEVYL